MSPEGLIAGLCERLSAEFGVRPIMGAELECYVVLPGTDAAHMDAFWKPVVESAPGLQRVEKEKGAHQYELVLSPCEDPGLLAARLTELRTRVEKQAAQAGVSASFAAKPYANAPGSGLHLHLSLRDSEGDSVLIKTDDYISPVLHHALGGLCALMPHVMVLACPTPEGFARYGDADHIARNVSWGSNNRTCALRIPYSPIPDDKRIEWRVPAADAAPAQVIAVMLAGVVAGLAHRLEPPPQYHGLAARDSSLAPLPLTLEEARAAAQTLPDIFAPLSAAVLEEWGITSRVNGG